MTADNAFPFGYFYIVSKLNNLVLDIRDPQNATIDSKIVMAVKKPVSPERDTQLWIHQDGYLTNKASGLVLEAKKAESLIAIITRERRLYLDVLVTDADAPDVQQFGYDSENGYIYPLKNPDVVLDIRHEDINEDARVMIYKKKPLEEATNQLWTIELADPPRNIDSDDESEDDSKRERIKAWFGRWDGWGHKKRQVLSEKELEEANKKVYKEKKSKASYELIAAAAAYEAVNVWEKKQAEGGEEVHHATAKKFIAGLAAKELVKLMQERGSGEEIEESHKRDLLTTMASAAATNYFDSKHSS